MLFQIGSLYSDFRNYGKPRLYFYKDINVKASKRMEEYKPTVSVTTKKIGDKIEIKLSDNGHGISQKVLDKILQPFFTTKPTGQATRMGLSLSYDIVKAHGGELKEEKMEARPDDSVGWGEGSEFVIVLSC